MRTLLLSAALAVLSLATPASAAKAISLNPSRPHLLLIGGTPDIRVYERPGLTGRPVLKLDSRGLEVRGRRACVWPGGELDELNDPSVVLEVAGAPGKPCTGYPIISTWNEGGDGSAVIYVEVVRRTGNILEVSFEGKPHYLDWAAMPAESWLWIDAQASEQATQARGDAVAKDPAFQRFIERGRRCLGEADPSTCFTSLLSPSVHVDWLDRRVPAKELTDRLFSEPGYQELQHNIGLCFEDESVDVSADGFVTLGGTDLVCQLARVDGEWRLDLIYYVDNC